LGVSPAACREDEDEDEQSILVPERAFAESIEVPFSVGVRSVTAVAPPAIALH
jgi:hypothetical protein